MQTWAFHCEVCSLAALQTFSVEMLDGGGYFQRNRDLRKLIHLPYFYNLGIPASVSTEVS